MQYRIGKCASCGASFKVPESFPGDKAKCKSCKTGVVEIGPVQSEGNQEKTALEEHEPSGKRGDGPSMIDQLRAKRAEHESPRPVPATHPRTARPGANKDSAGGAASKTPAAKPSAADKSSGRATSSPVRGVQRASSQRSASASKVTRSAGRRGSARSKRRTADEDAQGTGRGRRKPEKKSPMGMVVIVLGVLVLAVVGWKFFSGSDDLALADAGEATDTTPAESSPDTPIEVPEEAPEEVPEAASEPEPEPEPAPKPEKKPSDPASVDLSELEVFGPTEDTTETEWTEIKQLVVTLIDVDAGAAGPRAGRKLQEQYGKWAFGAVINAMVKLDYSTEQGYRDGDVLQRLLMDIANGRNMGWKYSTSDEDHLFNKKVVGLLHKTWSRARNDEAHWKWYSKQDKDDAAKPEDEANISTDDLDDLDDLDF